MGTNTTLTNSAASKDVEIQKLALKDIARKNPRKIKQWLDTNPDFVKNKEELTSCLYSWVILNNTEAINECLKIKTLLEQVKDSDLLIKASAKGQSRLVVILINAGFNPNFIGSVGATPLDVAARFGNVGVVDTLIKAGANIDLVTHSTLLEAATKHKIEACASILSKYPQDILVAIREGALEPAKNVVDLKIHTKKFPSLRPATARQCDQLIKSLATSVLKRKLVSKLTNALRKGENNIEI